MATSNHNSISLTTLIEAGSSCTTPLDAAADYWRSRAGRLLPLYVLAMGPHAVAAALLIAAITGEQRVVAGRCCIYLAAATLWRWVWIARLQHRVQEDLRSQLKPVFWSRIPQILLVRLYANAAINWGIVLACVPSFYGLFIGSYAAPLLLESDEPAAARVRQALSWIHHSGSRLFRILLVLSALTVILLVAMFSCQYILSATVLPTLLAIETADLNLTLNGWAWRLSVCYFAFLIIDSYWSVAAVFVYYDSQSRRIATDLRARLMVLTEETP